MNVSNGEQFLELCKTVVAAAGEGEDMQSAAEALLVASIFNTMDHETMQSCHRICDSGRIRLLERGRRMTTKVIKEFGLHIEIVIDDDGKHCSS
jgi:hypothetical protein